MKFLKSFILLDEQQENIIMTYKEQRKIFNNYYPINIFSLKEFQDIEFENITIFYGENYNIVKETKYDDFESFYTAEATKMDPLYQGGWIYDNNGKNIQFSISINSTIAEINFVLLG